ncbi:MAG: ABC transporter permease [Patescibacteria group bacterium]|nr:MAG: ABC transporter permease [Patescibacteria group bacterium]
MTDNYYILLFKTAVQSILRAKLRSFLTVLGIMIGVMSVVLLMAFGLGIKNYISEQFQELGSNILYVVVGKIDGNLASGSRSLASNFRFKLNDVLSLKRLPEADIVVPIYLQPRLKIQSGKNSFYGDLVLSDEGLHKAYNYQDFVGKFFDSSSLYRKEKVAYLGWNTAVELFDNPVEAVGKTVVVSGVRLRVIGVAKEKGGGSASDFDNNVVAPYTAFPQLDPENNFYFIYLKAVSEDRVNVLKQRVIQVLSRSYQEDDFSVIEPTEMLNAVLNIFSFINLGLVGIGAISLVVGGVGVMNVMYMSVTERIKEIGIRRAIGAKKNDILLQFLVESIILSLFGAVIGLILSYIVVLLIKPYFAAEIDLAIVAIAVGVSIAIGVFFGSAPARRAANLEPVSAIRYE